MVLTHTRTALLDSYLDSLSADSPFSHAFYRYLFSLKGCVCVCVLLFFLFYVLNSIATVFLSLIYTTLSLYTSYVYYLLYLTRISNSHYRISIMGQDFPAGMDNFSSAFLFLQTTHNNATSPFYLSMRPLVYRMCTVYRLGSIMLFIETAIYMWKHETHYVNHRRCVQ